MNDISQSLLLASHSLEWDKWRIENTSQWPPPKNLIRYVHLRPIRKQHHRTSHHDWTRMFTSIVPSDSTDYRQSHWIYRWYMNPSTEQPSTTATRRSSIDLSSTTTYTPPKKRIIHHLTNLSFRSKDGVACTRSTPKHLTGSTLTPSHIDRPQATNPLLI